MKKYICICDSNTGFAELENVGFFEATTKEEALMKARKQWGSSGKIYVELVENCNDGWSYFN